MAAREAEEVLQGVEEDLVTEVAVEVVGGLQEEGDSAVVVAGEEGAIPILQREALVDEGPKELSNGVAKAFGILARYPSSIMNLGNVNHTHVSFDQ